jgi:membrane fusion protein, multidrug efflux system
MKKRMTIMLIGVALLFGGIFAYKTFSNIMMKRYFASQEHIVTVSAMHAKIEPWQPQQKYYGSLRAVQGVNVTTELAALVEKIYLKPGAMVKKGELLVQLNAKSDIALLHSLEAQTALAKITYERDKAQYAIQAVSKATLDADAANLKSLIAQTAQQAEIVKKKSIRAPFAGRLGITTINEGQYINTGETIVPLQDLEYLYADFYVPQQQLAAIKLNQPVQLSIDAFPNRIFTGKINTINPVVDINTRNAQVEAIIYNPKYEIIPGMFASIIIDLGAPNRYITLPQTAISFNSYGKVIFTISEQGKDKKGKPILTVQQRFVTTGDSRGDQVSILQGLNVGDHVVTSGQLKLKNGTRIVINNSVVPTNNPAPQVIEE